MPMIARLRCVPILMVAGLVGRREYMRSSKKLLLGAQRMVYAAALGEH